MTKSKPPLHILIEENWSANTHPSETLHKLIDKGYNDVSLRYVIQRFNELDKIYARCTNETLKGEQ